jgi:hypothetical protein
MRLLFSRSASPHHGFAAYYTYLEHVFKVRPSLAFSSVFFSVKVSCSGLQDSTLRPIAAAYNSLGTSKHRCACSCVWH